MTDNPQVQGLTDAELRELADDPRFDAGTMAKLTPDEKTRLAVIKRTPNAPPPLGTSTRPGPLLDEKVADVGTGIAKGAGTTATTLGHMVSNPVTTALGNKLAELYTSATSGPEAVSPPVNTEQAFGEAYKGLEPVGPYQKAGKAIEQVGEFLIPGGATREAVTRGAIAAAPGARLALSQSGRVGNALVNLLERGSADALSTGAVASLHGDQHPGYEAGAAAAIPGVVGGLSRAAGPLLTAAPYAMGAGVGHLAGFGGLAGTLGLSAYVRALMRGEVATPAAKAAARAFIDHYGPQAFRAVIGTYGQKTNRNP